MPTALLLLLACAPERWPDPAAEDDLSEAGLWVRDLLDAGVVPPPMAGPPSGPRRALAGAVDFEVPATIRVWRASEGADSSCDGPVEELPLEEYVKGVLPHEWIRSWENESLLAGAIAIRSYATWWVLAGGKYDCADICDTTSCQVYDDARYDNTDQAVDDTVNTFAVEGGAVVFAEYSAENGDPTAYGVDEPYCTGEEVFGHGRGMCQWGSQRWAAYDGADHTWIVEHYYPGCEVITANADLDGDGYSEEDGDCDDEDPTSFPGAPELCDGVDQDCDDEADEDYERDGDGWRTCDGDCVDDDPAVHPGATELDDLRDNDCDFITDEGTASYDDDGDGWTEAAGDCDDADGWRFPGAPEYADSRDQDCDGVVDESTDTSDDDGDGWSEEDGDCSDADAALYPGAPERSGGLDEDCDGVVDEGTTSYDDDGDGWTEAAGDCDDGNGWRFPGAPELLDGADGDCDGVVDEGTTAYDDDGDDWTEQGGDCDDMDPAIHPGAAERVDGWDGDCDGVVDEGTESYDDDGDGWAERGGDCDDADPGRYPGAPERIDGLDGDCDGVVDEGTAAYDDDGDGYSEDRGDCDDGSPLIGPGAPEAIDGRDGDCDGMVDEDTLVYDDDGDGWAELRPDGSPGDCDDSNASIYPGAPDPLDGVDADCDGTPEYPAGWEAGGCDTGPGVPRGLLLLPAWLLSAVRRRRPEAAADTHPSRRAEHCAALSAAVRPGG